MVNTLLARHEQTHRDELSHNMAQYSHVFQDQLRALTGVPVATRRPGHRGASGARHPEPHAHRTGVALVVCGRLPLSRGAVLLCAPIAFAMAKVRKRGGPTMAH